MDTHAEVLDVRNADTEGGDTIFDTLKTNLRKRGKKINFYISFYFTWTPFTLIMSPKYNSIFSLS